MVNNIRHYYYSSITICTPIVETLIGSQFMAKEGWVLDFEAKIMYKLRAA